MSYSNIYGFSQGYGLNTFDLSGLTPVPPAATAMYTPSLISMNGPQQTVQNIQASLLGSSGVGQYNLSVGSGMQGAGVCKNATDGGAVQCMDKAGMCQPPVNGRCPSQSLSVNQFNGTMAQQPAALSFSITRN